ncbi:hypothetical protein [Aquisphaera insulae]|uniref:hypothetical protein n=1 Tax=Aquisphaera insulae TaxID=2712864 RepID=UPI0013EDBC79|nr:hypothetical protein [Aquisphaera insulae]
MKTRSFLLMGTSLAATILLALAHGCGEAPAPTASTPQEIEQVREKQKEIIAKERGPNAGKALKKR